METILASDNSSGSETKTDADSLENVGTTRLPLITDEIIGVTVEAIETPKANLEELTTITNSVSENPTKLIDKEYFITKHQRVNLVRNEEDPEWTQLEKNIMSCIDNKLKTRMIMKAQQVELTISVGGEERLIQTFNEIGLKWKDDSSVETATKINSIINGHFEEWHGYEYYMENEIMNQFNLKYCSNDDMTKGSIARMVVKKRVNLSKAVNRRSETTHKQTIVKKRSVKETENHGKRRRKICNGFKTGDRWYDGAGSIATNVMGNTTADQLEFYKLKIEEIKLQYDQEKEKVLQLSNVMLFSNPIIHLMLLFVFTSIG